MKLSIEDIITHLEELETKARLRANLIAENGRIIPVEHRAKSEGYAEGYAYAILLLKWNREKYEQG